MYVHICLYVLKPDLGLALYETVIRYDMRKLFAHMLADVA